MKENRREKINKGKEISNKWNQEGKKKKRGKHKTKKQEI